MWSNCVSPSQLVGCELEQLHSKTVLQYLQELTTGTHESRNSTPGCITHRNVYVCSHEDSSEQHYARLSKTEATQMSFHVEWVSELWTAHSMGYSTALQ